MNRSAPLGYHSTRWQWLGRHLLFWVAYFLFIPYQTYLYGFTTDYNLRVTLEWIPVAAVIIYTFLYGILPLLLSGRPWLFWVMVLVWGGIVWQGIYLYYNYVLMPIRAAPSTTTYQYAMAIALINISVTGIAVCLKLGRQWYQKDSVNQQLIQASGVAELQLLKAQIHPHFLFNTHWLNLFFEYLPTYLFFTYGLLIFIIPCLLEKRYGSGAGLLIGLSALTLVVQKLAAEIDIYFVQPLAFNFTAETPFTWSDVWTDLSNPATWITFSFDFLLVGFCAVGIKLFKARMQKQADNDQLEQETLQAELKLIKTQINAEFLFNTLADLHQSTTQKSPESPQMVLRLANLMRYLLYESQADEVPLEREVAMLEDYVFLAKTHYKHTTSIALTVSGDLTTKLIAPLLLLPLLENAFADTSGVDQSWVTIQLSVTGRLLKFSMLKGVNQRVAVRFESVEKRLRHLYPNRYEFNVISEEDVLIIKLDLVLNESQPALNPSDYEPTGRTGR